jgi:predicted HNH restriction endonuclease
MTRTPVEPKARSFAQAFSAVRPKMTDREIRMLEAHFLAPNRQITSIDLARAAGYSTFRPANRVYSNLGQKLRNELGLPRRDEDPLVSVFVDFPRKTPETDEWVFSMRPTAAQALSSLGWFDESEFDGASDEALSTKIAREGQVRVRLQRHRQREQSLRRTKLREALRASGRLTCEVRGCGFDFAAVYGGLGDGFAEVYHVVPLAEYDGPRETRLEDLAIVCSNCHRMIHRDGGSRTLEDVAKALRKDGLTRRLSRRRASAGE